MAVNSGRGRMGELLFWCSVTAYAVASGMIAINHFRPVAPASALVWWLVAVGWLFHGVVIGTAVYAGKEGLAVDLGPSLEVVAWVTGLLFLVGWRLRPQAARSVGLLLLPLMTLLLLISRLLANHHPVLRQMGDPVLITHFVLSMLAYGLFFIAALIALLGASQDHALRAKRLGGLFTALPPLGVLEEALFSMVRLGFFLLTLSILTGTLYIYQEKGVLITLTHKVIFTWATWVVFGILLLGRHFYGWRGRRAVRLTLAGTLFLLLSFWGVKFVSQVLLGR